MEDVKSAKRDPLAKFNALDDEMKDKVNEIVDDVVEAIGGNEPDLEMLLPVLEKLNALKKAAREVAAKKEKAAREDANAKAEMLGAKLLHHLKEGDEIVYLAKSAGIFVTEKVIKVTEKRVRVEVGADSHCVVEATGEEVSNDIGLVKFGVKSVMPKAITEVNGTSVEDFLASFEG